MKTEWCEVVIGVLLIVFSNFWNSQIIITILAAVLIVHAFMCKSCCGCCEECETPVKKAKKK
jgi:hypothetical protein